MNIISAYRLKYFKIIGLRDGFLCGLKMKKYIFCHHEELCDEVNSLEPQMTGGCFVVPRNDKFFYLLDLYE